MPAVRDPIRIRTRVAQSLTLASLALLAAAPVEAQPASSGDAACTWEPACSTPGATLEVIEQGRVVHPRRGAVVTYRLRAAGLPAGPAYLLWVRRLDRREQWIVAGYAVDSSGGLRCADRAAFAELAREAGTGWCPLPLDSIPVTLDRMLPGEPVEFALRAHGAPAAAYARVIPHPVQASADGCMLSARLLDESRKAVVISGGGFAPGEALRTTSTSGDERVDGTATAGADGSFPTTVVLPAAKGAGRGGEATYEVAGSRCALRLQYPWGRSLKPV